VPLANYQQFVADTKTLCNTIVVKSEATADAINNYVQTVTGQPVDDSNPASWKYYLNMGGIYHAIDTVMTVQSLDTQQTIVFSVANLSVHLATKKAYVFGSQYYKDLVARYPDQEELILGIINPVNIVNAVNADDNAILWYDPTLVESNETNLIPQLQQWINGYIFRYNNPAYSMVDPLWIAYMLKDLFAFMPLAIWNIRLANCRSIYTHSFHYTEFLASNGGLDPYVQWMTLGQSLALYRNIRYIMRNAGKTATFNWLVDNVLTPQGIPLASFDMQFNVSGMPDSIVPQIQYARKPVNLGFNLSGTDIRTTDELLTEEGPLARSNETVTPYFESTIDAQFQSGLQDNLPTKILESNMTDTTDSAPFTLSSMLLNEWIYLASLGYYQSYINIPNPAKATSYELTVGDAFVLYYYCFYAQSGITLTDIPIFLASCVLREDQPTLAQMEAMVDPAYVPSSYLAQAQALTPQNFNTVYVSVQAFYNAVAELHQTLLTQRFIYTQMPTFQGRAQAESAILSQYEDIGINLSPSIPDFASWLLSRNIDLSDMSDTEFGTLAETILAAATGTDLQSTDTLASTQAALLAVMTKLSSYTVQYIQVITPQGLMVADWAAPRVGDIHQLNKYTVHVDSAPEFNSGGDNVHVRYRLQANLGSADTSMDRTITLKISAKLNTNLDCLSTKGVNHHYAVPLSRVVGKLVPPVVTNLSALTQVNPAAGYQPIVLTPVSDQLLYNEDNTYLNVASTDESPFQES
jgi:hypothetical protein